MDQRRDTGISRDACEQRQHAERWLIVQQRRADAADCSDERTDRKIKVIDSDDEHLGDCRERDWHRVLQHQRQPEITHGARLNDEGRREHDGERQERQ